MSEYEPTWRSVWARLTAQNWKSSIGRALLQVLSPPDMPLCSNRGMICALYIALVLLIGGHGDAQTAKVDMEVTSVYPQAEALYRDLHEHPELSGHEKHTATILANGLRQLGFEVTAGVGGTGVVGVLKNGPGESRPVAH